MECSNIKVADNVDKGIGRVDKEARLQKQKCMS